MRDVTFSCGGVCWWCERPPRVGARLRVGLAWTCEAFQCRYGYPMDIIHPCGIWMYRGMRDCWMLVCQFKKSLVSCSPCVYCACSLYHCTEYTDILRIFIPKFLCFLHRWSTRTAGHGVRGALQVIHWRKKTLVHTSTSAYMDLCLLSLWVDQFSVTFMTPLNGVFQD